jgi:hypothetical protein
VAQTLLKSARYQPMPQPCVPYPSLSLAESQSGERMRARPSITCYCTTHREIRIDVSMHDDSYQGTNWLAIKNKYQVLHQARRPIYSGYICRNARSLVPALATMTTKVYAVTACPGRPRLGSLCPVLHLLRKHWRLVNCDHAFDVSVHT